jgi:hypothetical protein
MLIDYSFSRSTNNYNYPELGKWQSGIQDNLLTYDNYIQPLQGDVKELPEFKIGNSTYTSDNILSDMYTMNTVSPDVTNGTYINLIPVGSGITRTWSTVTSNLLFDNLSAISNDLRGIYGIFKSPATGSTSEKILLKIQNTVTNDYIKVSLSGTTLAYRANIGGVNVILGTDSTVAISTAFTVGFNFNTLVSLSTANFQNFFGNKSQLIVYVGGDYSGSDPLVSTTFAGNIYTISFLNSKTLSTVSSSFDANGIIGTTISNSLLTNYPTYGLILKTIVDNSYLDIRSKSSWQDQIPISVLSKYVTNTSGINVYSLDYVQLNIDYPELEIFTSGNYDSSKAIAKSYITFQYLSDGANKNSSDYTNIVSMLQNKTITPNALDWKTSKYEFVNNTICYMPTSFDSLKTLQDLAIVIHIDFYVEGTIYNPIKIKTLQISPKSLNSNVVGDLSPNNAIGTKFNVDLYPTIKSGGINYFTGTNPIIINKESSQYLNLTNSSGVKLAGDTTSTDRSLLMYVNKNSLANFNISSIQMSLLWNEKFFPTTAVKILQINNGKEYPIINFYIVSTNIANNRGKIYATKGSGPETSFTDLNYYWNGLLVNQPYLNIKEWGMLGISFNNLIKFDAIGEIKLTSNMLVNNLSYYQLDPNKLSQQINNRTWNTVSSSAWSYWNTGGGGVTAKYGDSWTNMLTAAGNIIPAISPSTTYKIFTGTNKNIFDADLNSGKLRPHAYQYKVYQNSLTTSQILKPQ